MDDTDAIVATHSNKHASTAHSLAWQRSRTIAMTCTTIAMITIAMVCICVIVFDSFITTKAESPEAAMATTQMNTMYDDDDDIDAIVEENEPPELAAAAIHPIVLPSCASWFAGGPIDICITKAHGHPQPHEIEVSMSIDGKNVWNARLNRAHEIHVLNITRGNIQVAGVWHFRRGEEFGQVGQGLWADLYYNEGTPAKHHFKGELVSLDTRPSPTSHGRWWGIYHLTWRREHDPTHHNHAVSLHSYRGNLLAGKLQLGGGLRNSIDFEFIWGDDGHYIRGTYRLDQQQRQLVGSLRLCPSKQCRTFSGVIASWR